MTHIYEFLINYVLFYIAVGWSETAFNKQFLASECCLHCGNLLKLGCFLCSGWGSEVTQPGDNAPIVTDCSVRL